MSGIAAILERRDPVPDRKLHAAFMEELRSTSTDASGTWEADHIVLGAQQFWSTPEDWDTIQPAVDEAAGVAVALDGRIDNRYELGQLLGLSAADLRGSSDAELVVRAYRRWGDAFPTRLCGPFAVAVWDRPAGRLVCSRDPVGQRPLFYRVTPLQVHVASSIRALRRDATCRETLNDDYFWDFLGTSGTVGSFDPVATPFADILRLPAGHTLVATVQTVRVHRHWKPWEDPDPGYRDDREYVEDFRATFDDVVRAHCRAPGLVTATLSGGLDSSSIVCAIRSLERSGELAGDPIHTITLAWDEPAGPRQGYDERRYAQAVIDRWPGPAHFVEGDTLDGLDFFSPDRPYYDEPLGLFGQIWGALASQAHGVGSRVLIAGSGGDHLLFGGPFAITDAFLRGRFPMVVRNLRSFAREGGLPYPGLISAYLLAPLLPRHVGARLVAAVTKDMDRRAMDTFFYWSAPEWLRDPAAQRLRGGQRHRLLRRRYRSYATQKDFEQLELGSQDHMRLPLYHVARSRGVDLRNPFFDGRMLSLCLRLPARLKNSGGLTKVALRRALADRLPTALLERRDKTAYDFAIVDHVKRQWVDIRDLYSDAESDRRGFVNATRLLGEIAPLQQGGGGEIDVHAVIAACSVEDWLRRTFQRLEEPTSGGNTSYGRGRSSVEHGQRRGVNGMETKLTYHGTTLARFGDAIEVTLGCTCGSGLDCDCRNRNDGSIAMR